MPRQLLAAKYRAPPLRYDDDDDQEEEEEEEEEEEAATREVPPPSSSELSPPRVFPADSGPPRGVAVVVAALRGGSP